MRKAFAFRFFFDLIMDDFLTLSYTDIGVLPHSDVDEALSFIENKFFHIPFLPQLPNVNKFENLLLQCIENLVGLKRSSNKIFVDKSFALSSMQSENVNDYEINYCCALRKFLSMLESQKPMFAKFQIIGPFSFSMTIKDENNQFIFFDKDLRDVVVNHLTMKARWFAKQIFSKGVRPIVFINEPSLSMLGRFSDINDKTVKNMLKQIVLNLKSSNIVTGIHCDTRYDWDMVLDIQPDIISFDAFTYAKEFSESYRNISKFIDNGGFIAWGLVPAFSEDILSRITVDTLYLGYYMAVNYLELKGVPKKKIIKSSMITTSCGMDNLSVELSKRAMILTRELAEKLKE